MSAKYEAADYDDSEEEEVESDDGEKDNGWTSIVDYEIELEEDVFCGFAALSLQGNWHVSWFVAALWPFVSLALQAYFVMYLLPAISEDEYVEKLDMTSSDGSSYNLFEMWSSEALKEVRRGGTKAHLVCGGESFSWEESQADDLGKYADGVVFLGVPMAQGRFFGTLVLMVWAATVMEVFRRWAHYVMLLHHLTEIEGLDLSVQNNKIFKATICVFSLARFTVNVCIACYGNNFLARTDNLKDFILNSVALGFLFEIPQLLYGAFGSTREKKFLRKINDGKVLTKLPKWFIESDGISSALWAALLLANGLSVLHPFSKNIEEAVFGKLCPDGI